MEELKNTFILIASVLAFLYVMLRGRAVTKRDAEILDLTNKIKDKQDKEAIAKANADKAVKEYQDALKKYDPDFHGDDGSGKPTN